MSFILIAISAIGYLFYVIKNIGIGYKLYSKLLFLSFVLPSIGNIHAVEKLVNEQTIVDA